METSTVVDVSLVYPNALATTEETVNPGEVTSILALCLTIVTAMVAPGAIARAYVITREIVAETANAVEVITVAVGSFIRIVIAAVKPGEVTSILFRTRAIVVDTVKPGLIASV